jgi:hypothetical protein
VTIGGKRGLNVFGSTLVIFLAALAIVAGLDAPILGERRVQKNDDFVCDELPEQLLYNVDIEVEGEY